MNLKYYLRGLGLGIVITAVLLGITAGSRKETLTDDEIITRAKALGMMEESELAQQVERAKAANEAGLRAEIEKELRDSLQKEIRAQLEAELAAQLQVSEETQDEASSQGETNAPDGAGASAESSAEPEPEPIPEPVEFIVYSGELPRDICKRLESAGLVESASEFEKFLLGNGYDRLVVAAKYSIPVDADAEQIARIITGHRN